MHIKTRGNPVNQSDRSAAAPKIITPLDSFIGFAASAGGLFFDVARSDFQAGNRCGSRFSLWDWLGNADVCHGNS